MKKVPLPAVLVGGLLLAGAAGKFPLWAEALLGVLGMLGWYRYSLWRRPLRACWVCGGAGWVTGSDPESTSRSRRPVGKCWWCQNRKGLPRWGLRVFSPSTRQAILRGDRGRNY